MQKSRQPFARQISARGRGRNGITSRPVPFVFALIAMGLIVIYAYLSWPSSASKTADNRGESQDHVVPTIASSDAQLDKNAKGELADPSDPSLEGWETEIFAEEAKKQLQHLFEMLDRPEEVAPSSCADMVTEEFPLATLVPASLEVTFRDETFQVERSTKIDKDLSGQQPQGTDITGAAGLASPFRKWAESFREAKDFRFKIKVTDVRIDGDTASTSQRISVAAEFDSHRLEQHVTWATTWQRSGPNGEPRLASLSVEDFVQTTANTEQGSLLADCTHSVLGENESFQSQVLRDYGSHLRRVQDSRFFEILGNPGMAIADVNGDGLEDIYLCQEEGLPNLLFLQQPDGTAINRAADWEIDWLHNSRSALFVDWDNDGDQDLAVAVLGGVIMASNEGSRFEVRSFLPTDDDTMSIATADIDLDGKLDLYVCVYVKRFGLETPGGSVVPGVGEGFVYHDATTGGNNSMFRNEGDWTFTDVTEEVGLGVGNNRFSLAASWEDFDNDGDADLYVANDFGPNNLYRNDSAPQDASAEGPLSSRKFTDVAALVGAADRASGMSVAWGDYDRNGWMDLYIGNMFSAAGRRIASQAQFRPGATADVRSALLRFARGNTLLKNQGTDSFVDTSEESGAMMGRWSWSSCFADINNDSWEDLLVTNGYVTGNDKRDL